MKSMDVKIQIHSNFSASDQCPNIYNISWRVLMETFVEFKRFLHVV